MAPVTYKQEMPPPGGYEAIIYHRIPAKKYVGAYGLFAGVIAMTIGALSIHTRYRRNVIRVEKLELNDCKLALEPILTAERERAFLKHIRAMREDEAELMKNVPGWEVGTYYGEPVYKTVDKDRWIDPLINEYYAQSDEKHFSDRIHYMHYS